MKLELKHLKNYLGTGLKFAHKLVPDKIKTATGIIYDRSDGLYCVQYFDDFWLNQYNSLSKDCDNRLKQHIKTKINNWSGEIISNVRPFLLPLSALTEPFPDGSVPIVELAKIEAGNFDGDKFIVGEIGKYRYFPNRAAFNNDEHICIYKTGFGRTKQILNYNSGNGFNSYYCFRDDMADVELRVLSNQLQLFEYLYANHFWLGDQSLFENGEIIDKRTVK